jgi:hypothetical protein
MHGLELRFAHGEVIEGLRDHPSTPYLLKPESLRYLSGRLAAGKPVSEEAVPEPLVPQFVNVSNLPDAEPGATSTVRCSAVIPYDRDRIRLDEVLVSFRLLDREGATVSSRSRRLGPADLHEVAPLSAPGRKAFLVGHRFAGVRPERYRIEVSVSTTGGEVLSMAGRPIQAKAFGDGLRIGGLEPLVPGSERWASEVFEGRPYLPTLAVVPRDPSGRLTFFYSISGLVAREGAVRYQPSITVVPTERLRLDLDAALASSEAPVTQAGLDQLLTRVPVWDTDYQTIVFEPVARQAPAPPGGVVVAEAGLSGEAQAPGDYSVIITVKDLYSEEAAAVASSAVPFRVVEPQALDDLLSGRR